MPLYGADIDQMRELGRMLLAKAEQLEADVARPLSHQILGSSVWRGPNAEGFRSDWSASLEPMIRRAAQQLRAASERLTANANEQEQASRGTGGSGVAVGGALPLRGTTIPRGVGLYPQATAKWWAGLSDAEKQRQIEENPEKIGNLDGVDAASRDKANRIVLAEAVKRARERLHEHEKNRSLWSHFVGDAELVRLRRQLEELGRIEDALYPGHSGDPRQLLTLDFSGERLKAAVSVGDVDKASHICVIVPGMTTNVHDSLQGNVDSAERLRNRTAALGGMRRKDIATVAWLGYDAPQDIIKASVAGDAHLGAERLSPFLTGIDSIRKQSPAGDPHMTVFGHSYGSTTSGFAATMTPDGVIDKLVLAGSPGSGVTSLEQYSVPKGNVYVSATPGDPFLGLGNDDYFKTDPRDLPGIKHLNADISDADHGFIIDPIEMHTSYLKEKTAALDDIALVSAGKK